jgi:AcrR family transcriptional regulator
MTTSLQGGAPDSRREAIDAAARRIAVGYGLSGITLRRLTSSLGVAPGLIAELEPSMGALIARTFEEVAAAELDETAADLARAASPLDGLRTVVEGLLDETHDNFNSIWADAWSLGRHNPPLARAAREAMVGWNDLFVRLVSDGIAAGQFADVDPDHIAQLFLALIDSTTAYRLVEYRATADHLALVRGALGRALGLPADTL